MTIQSLPNSLAHEAAEPVSSDYLVLDRVTKSYGGKAVVNKVSLAVGQGEVLTILGPSGCGKTTTLRMIAGFLEPDDGSILIGGNPVEKLSSHQRGAAMVFQNYALFPHMTVWRNVAFGLRMRGLAKPEIARQVGEMLDRVQLGDYAERFPKELSGGQQQRVALARALIIKPKVLLLDEPFSSLDAKLRKQLRAEFLEIHRTFGITSVFVTHDLEEAFAISDKVAVMNQGVLEQTGSPSQIFQRPQSRFVADFVGHKNILSGMAAPQADGRMHLKAAGLTIEIPRVQPGPITVSVPVHRLKFSRRRLKADNAYEGTVRNVAYLGPIIQIVVDVAGTALESYSPSSPELEALREGERVFLGFGAEDIVIIPGSGG